MSDSMSNDMSKFVSDFEVFSLPLSKSVPKFEVLILSLPVSQSESGLSKNHLAESASDMYSDTNSCFCPPISDPT